MPTKKIKKNPPVKAPVKKSGSPAAAAKKTITKTIKKGGLHPDKQLSKLDKQGLSGIPGTVSIRMYCIGTGDCFILKFFDKDGKPFTLMIDCGCCMGDRIWFDEYMADLNKYVLKTIDLLVVTHEHQDHVNGFMKWPEIFENFTIREAWFAWTENPADPDGAAAELFKKRTAMKAALGNAITEIKKRGAGMDAALEDHPFKGELIAAHETFVNGLDSLGEINLDETEQGGKELAGMKKIKEILKAKHVKTKYLNPGQTVTISGLPGIKFHVLGPPLDRTFIFKEGKQGTDVFKKNMALNESAMAAKAFNNLASGTPSPEDFPFTAEYITGAVPDASETATMNKYNEPAENWRRIDDEWLFSAGSLAIRLNSHINNTSLALAMESEKTGKVLLFPGDAEYGSWESWHLIHKWNNKGRGGKHLVEDLLNRTVFYKVGHHMSYNGTALEKGINMMESGNLAVMATLDRQRISKGWKTTMPNKFLLKELIRKTAGRFFIMNEKEVDNPPSQTLDPVSLGKQVYSSAERKDGEATLYKQFTLGFTI